LRLHGYHVNRVIDLHLHTTASDGKCTPAELVDRVFGAGISVMSVTDHDTRGGESAARQRAGELGIGFLSGIEITSVANGKDVHILAYGLPDHVPDIDALITTQRQLRVARAHEIADRLAKLGAPIDIEKLIAAAASTTGKAVARPQIAQWLIEAGHVASVAEAFDRFLSDQQPAYVPHQGASPVDVVALIGASRGISSLAHPGYTKQDQLIPQLVDAGMPCLEAFHSSHDPQMVNHYLGMARTYGIAVTGGSDYHGEGTRRAEFFGVVSLPVEHYERVAALVEGRRVVAQP
jgi:predicted metal-dependent phosphoesterase TrpH